MSINSYVHTASPGKPGGTLFFLFHGTGGDEHQLVTLGRDLLLDASLVSPRGDVSEQGAARFFRRTGEGVYDMADLGRGTKKMAKFVEAHVAVAKSERIVGLGYSNGANILASVLFARPGLFDAAVLMHPLIPFDPEFAGRLDGTEVLITAGRRDPICPPALTSRLEQSLVAHGTSVETEWHDGGHELRPNEVAAAKRFLDRVTNRENNNV